MEFISANVTCCNLFTYVICEACWILLWCCLKLATWCGSCGSLGRDSDVSQWQALSMPHLQQHVWSYKQSTVLAASAGLSCISKLTFTSNPQFWLLMLGLAAYGEVQAAFQSWLLPAPDPSGWWANITMHPEVCLLPPPASWLFGLVKKLIHWKNLLWSQENRVFGYPLKQRCHSDFQEYGECDSLPQNHSLSVSQIFSMTLEGKNPY